MSFKSQLLILLLFCLWAQLSHCDDTPSSPLNIETCRTYIQNLSKKYPNYDVNTLPPDEKYYVLFSGRRGALDFGNRKECEAQPVMRYVALVQELGGDIGETHFEVESGACVIRECSGKVIKDAGLVNELFRLNNWNIGGNLIVVDMDVPEKVPAFYYSLYLHLTLIGLVVLTTAIASFCRYMSSRRSNGTEVQPAKLHWFVEAFDLYTTMKSLLQTAKEQKQNENIAIFGFLKVMASFWIISCHSFGVTGTSSRSGGPCVGFCFYMVQGPLAVEYFFFMGGFIAIYALCPKFQNEGISVKSFLMHLKHRWMRIWPCVMMALIFFRLVLYYIGNGPLWHRYMGSADHCDTFWPNKMTLRDNYTVQGANCAEWTWYASVDVQSYVFIVIAAYAHVKTRLGGYLFLAFCYFKSLWWAQANVAAYGPHLNYYYVNTHSRAHEIFIGVAFGLHYFDYAKRNDKFNIYYLCEKVAVIKYAIILSGMYLNYYVVYYVPIYAIPYPDWLLRSKIYLCIATGLMFTPICTKEPFWLKDFLNIRIWQILAKLSFGAYLYHMPLLFYVRYTMDDLSPMFNEPELEQVVITVIKYAYAVSFIYFILLERPIGAIEAHFSKKKTNPAPSLTPAKAVAPKALQAKPIAEKISIPDREKDVRLLANGSRAEILSDDILNISDESPELNNSYIKEKRKLKTKRSSSKVQYQPL